MINFSACIEVVKQIIQSEGKLDVLVKMYKNIKTLKTYKKQKDCIKELVLIIDKYIHIFDQKDLKKLNKLKAKILDD